MARRLLGLVVVSVVLAGCIAPATPERDPSFPDDEGLALAASSTALPPLQLEAEGCSEGGGHSVHPKYEDYLPAPWEPGDVLEDLGPQLVYSELFRPTSPIPQEGDTMGNYHATVTCAGWRLNGEDAEPLVFGFVGMKVVPPPFDSGPPADRHYLVTVIGTSSHALHELLHAGGFHASMSTGVAEWLDGGAFHNVLDTEDHGVYEGLFLTKAMGDMVPRMRLWWQMENPNGTFSPVSLDLVNTGGAHLAAEAQGAFMHRRTADHPPFPGVVGKTSGLAYRDFDRVVTWGPRPDVLLEEAYIHL